MQVRRYDESVQNRWNDFLSNAKNYHFFFHRDYLAYHEGRFEDFSLLIYDDKEKLIALLPANREGNRLYSHQGLTYGGFIVNDNMKVVTMIGIFEALKSYLHAAGIEEVVYKTVPHIHHRKPAEEDRYALFLQDARLLQRDVAAAIDMRAGVKYSNGRKWSLKKAAKEGFEVVESEDFAVFWALLEEILYQQHGAKPVHSLEEMALLHARFPKNIRLFLNYRAGELLAGAVVFENPDIVHLQYVANSNEGRVIGALDYIIDHLIKTVYRQKAFFDFGTSNEEEGRRLNEGLIDQKERFGARAIAIDRYLWSVR